MATSVEDQDIPLETEEDQHVLVGWAISTTGYRLIDEICQLSAFMPDKKYDQYIMPYSSPNFYLRKQYGIQVHTINRNRIMKDMITNKSLKTKPETIAIRDFLSWLQDVKRETTKEIILVYHDLSDQIQLKMIETMKRYGLYEEFAKAVKGFCNICLIAHEMGPKSNKTYTLRFLAKTLLNKEESLYSAYDRAKTSYEICQELVRANNAVSIRQSLSAKFHNDAEVIRQICFCLVKHLNIGESCPDSPASERCEAHGTSETDLSKLLKHFASPLSDGEKELNELQEKLKVQSNYAPVFKDYLTYNRHLRITVLRLRRNLIEKSIKVEEIKTIWEKTGRKGLEVLFQQLNLSKSDYEDIVEIFDTHFDPKKEPLIVSLRKERQQYYRPPRRENKGPSAKKGAKINKPQTSNQDASANAPTSTQDASANVQTSANSAPITEEMNNRTAQPTPRNNVVLPHVRNVAAQTSPVIPGPQPN